MLASFEYECPVCKTHLENGNDTEEHLIKKHNWEKDKATKESDKQRKQNRDFYKHEDNVTLASQVNSQLDEFAGIERSTADKILDKYGWGRVLDYYKHPGKPNHKMFLGAHGITHEYPSALGYDNVSKGIQHKDLEDYLKKLHGGIQRDYNSK